jgi:hypothetical protein
MKTQRTLVQQKNTRKRQLGGQECAFFGLQGPGVTTSQTDCLHRETLSWGELKDAENVQSNHSLVAVMKRSTGAF